MARKESVLSKEEKESFEIEKFIFHIIKNDDDQPLFLTDVTLDAGQKNFFKKRFEEVSEGVQHSFTDKTTSDFYRNCAEMLADPDSNFLTISKTLAASFQNTHKGNTLDGAFIIAIVTVEINRRLIFLLKIDHKKVYGYEIKDTKAILNEVANAFVEDRKAIQKSALVDISDHYIWDVLASDRSGSAEKPVTDFFCGFLSVHERENASNLTLKVIQTVREWAIANREELDLQEDLAHYKQKAIDYLRAAPEFDAAACIDSIFRDEKIDAATKTNFGANLKGYFDAKGLSGQKFVPQQGSISAAVRKNIRKTAEGVKIEWEGEMKDNNIEIPTMRHQDGFYHIVIKTDRIDILDKK